MKNWKIFITFILLLTVILGNFHSANAQQNLAQQAYAIFEQSCLNCHGEHGAFTEEITIDHTALIETGAVVPGKPIESELYKRLLVNDPAKRMPLGQPQLPPAAILTIGIGFKQARRIGKAPLRQMAPSSRPRRCLIPLRSTSTRFLRSTAPSHAILHSPISITPVRVRRHSTPINGHSRNS